jgi:hypothetical protein
MTAPQEILNSGAQGAEPSTQVGVSAPIFFTEQEIAFSTAVALPVRPATTRRPATAAAVVLAALRWMVLTLTLTERAPRRYYSTRHEFLERARMAREMERL